MLKLLLCASPEQSFLSLYSSEASYRMADLFFSVGSVLCLMHKTDWFWRGVRIDPGSYRNGVVWSGGNQAAAG